MENLNPESSDARVNIKIEDIGAEKLDNVSKEILKLSERIQLYDEVIVIKDIPEKHIFQGYIGDVLDTPFGVKGSVYSVEFMGGSKEHPHPIGPFYISRKDLIKCYRNPLVRFNTPLEWNETEFLVTKGNKNE